MWKQKLTKIIIRITLIKFRAVILTLLATTVFYQLSTIGIWTLKETTLYRHFVNFKIILVTVRSLKIIYWYMVGLLTLESIESLIFKNPLLIVTDTVIFRGLEDGVFETLAEIVGWQATGGEDE